MLRHVIAAATAPPGPAHDPVAPGKRRSTWAGPEAGIVLFGTLALVICVYEWRKDRRNDRRRASLSSRERAAEDAAIEARRRDELRRIMHGDETPTQIADRKAGEARVAELEAKRAELRARIAERERTDEAYARHMAELRDHPERFRLE